MATALRTEDPTRIGDYTLTNRLGQGGQGTVYLGRAADGTAAAVKVLNPGLATDQRYLVRFAREVEAARKVARFCTAAVLDADITATTPYIATEYIPGPSLKEDVERYGPRLGASLERLAIATATALAAVHQAGVIHRDLKPANVILGPDGPRVIDFGIARAHDLTMTRGQSLIGTPAYMAPEQARGKEATQAVDIFSWACVIAYAATGASPFQADTVPTTLHRVLTETPSLDGVTEPLRSIVASCLSKDPAERPDALALLASLLGQDPEATAAVPVDEVLKTGYTAATQEIAAVPPLGGTGMLHTVPAPRTVSTGVVAAGATAPAEPTGTAGVPEHTGRKRALRWPLRRGTPTPDSHRPGGERGGRGRAAARRALRRRPVWIAASAATVLALAGLTGWLWLGQPGDQPAQPLGLDITDGPEEPTEDKAPSVSRGLGGPPAPAEPEFVPEEPVQVEDTEPEPAPVDEAPVEQPPVFPDGELGQDGTGGGLDPTPPQDDQPDAGDTGDPEPDPGTSPNQPESGSAD